MKYRIVSFRTHWQMSYSLAGSIAQWLVYLLMDPAAPCLIPSIPKAFSKEKIVNFAKANPHPCLEGTGYGLKMLIKPI